MCSPGEPGWAHVQYVGGLGIGKEGQSAYGSWSI